MPYSNRFVWGLRTEKSIKIFRPTDITTNVSKLVDTEDVSKLLRDNNTIPTFYIIPEYEKEVFLEYWDKFQKSKELEGSFEFIPVVEILDPDLFHQLKLLKRLLQNINPNQPISENGGIMMTLKVFGDELLPFLNQKDLENI